MTTEPDLSSAEFDLALDDLVPADFASEEAESNLWVDDLDVMAAHTTGPYGSHSYVVAHDRSATWGLPGAPQVLSIAVARDFDLGMFTLEHAVHASVPFAQAWLVERGCPPERISVPDGVFAAAGDDATRRIERKIRAGGQRYEVLDSLTDDDRPYETWVLTRDRLAAQTPFRIFLEQHATDGTTYAVREGAFDTADAAIAWTETRDSPLPPAPHDQANTPAARARAALARSPGSTGPRVVCGLDTLPPPTPPPANEPGQRRPL